MSTEIFDQEAFEEQQKKVLALKDKMIHQQRRADELPGVILRLKNQVQGIIKEIGDYKGQITKWEMEEREIQKETLERDRELGTVLKEYQATKREYDEIKKKIEEFNKKFSEKKAA